MKGWRPSWTSEVVARRCGPCCADRRAAEGDAEPSEPAIAPASSPEILVFVGPPASGSASQHFAYLRTGLTLRTETSYYRNHFEPAGYEWINQDTLGKRDKCIAKAREALQKGKSVVIGEQGLCARLCIPSDAPSCLSTDK